MEPRVFDLKARRAKVVKERQQHVDKLRKLFEREADLPDDQQLPEADQNEIESLNAAIQQLTATVATFDQRIANLEGVLAIEGDAAMASDEERGDDSDNEDREERGAGAGQRRGAQAGRGRNVGGGNGGHRVYAQVERKVDRASVVPSAMRFLMRAGNVWQAGMMANADPDYGERHPVTRALMLSNASSGGLIVPPDYVADLIELQRPLTVVRSAGPRVISMPHGTMQMPRQSQAATASYGGEVTAIPVSEQAFGGIVAVYKKLTALVPISNDLRRYSNPSVDAIARDDLVRVLALREDLAFLRSDGTQNSPKGFASWALAAQKIASTAVYTLATVANELGGAINKLESNNVAIINPCWMFHPRTKNYLLNVQNSNGFYVFKDEMNQGKLLGIPYKTTTQIPTNLVVGGDSDCSEVYLVEMSEAMVFDSMSLEIAISQEGTYVDSTGATVSVFQSDQTLIRAIAEHDFAMRHDNAIAMITGVRWAPAIL